MSTEYIDSLRDTLLSGIAVEYPHLTKSACESIVEDIISAHPQGLMKQASFFDVVRRVARDHEVQARVGQEVMSTAGKAAIAMMAGAGLYGINRVVRSAEGEVTRSRFEAALRTCLSSNDSAGQIIKSAPPEKVRSLATTIFNYAPNVASDVNLLKTLLATFVNSDGMDSTTIRSLQELEMNRQKINTWKPADIGFKG